MARKMFLVLLLFISIKGTSLAQQSAKGTTSERIIRSMVLNATRPIYPEDAIHGLKTGVCVAKVSLDASGHVAAVQVVEAPTPSISASVSKAVSQWQFKPFRTKNEQPILISGKLTFYFEIQSGQGLVLDPADAGYVGNYPKAKTPLTMKH